MSYPMIEIGDLMLKRNSSVNPSKFPNETFELHSIPAFDRGFPDIVNGSEIGSSKQLVQENDVMISKIVPHIRRASVVCKAGDFRQIASGEWIVFRSDKIYPDYLKHVLISDNFNKQFMATVSGVGGSLLRARPAFVSKIKVTLPPLEEQRRIASILDKADELRQKRQQAIEKLDQLLQSTFIDMFGDPVTNPKGWMMGKIGDMLESVKYGSSDKAELEGEIPILRMNNLTYSGEMDLTSLKYITKVQADEKYLVKEGDILFNRTNSKELVGKTAVYVGPEPMAYAGYLVRGRTKDGFVPEYISAFLNSPWGKEKLQSMCKSIVGMANINAKEFQTIVLPIPPSSLQTEFKTKVLAIKSNKQLLLNQLNEMQTLFNSLQNQAFSGTL